MNTFTTGDGTTISYKDRALTVNRTNCAVVRNVESSIRKSPVKRGSMSRYPSCPDSNTGRR